MMTQQRTAVLRERRAKPINLEDLGIAHPGEKRLHEVTKETVINHDNEWKKADSVLWQNNYELAQHLERARELLISVGAAKGLEGELAVRAIAGFYHDISKVEEPYNSLSRKNGGLTKSELRIMAGHTKRSAVMLAKLMKNVRREDRQIFRYALPIVRYHDKPYMIFRTWLRRICWDLYFIDCYLACREKRHDRSLSVCEAIDSIKTRSVQKLPWWVRLYFCREIKASLAYLEQMLFSRSDA